MNKTREKKRTLWSGIRFAFAIMWGESKPAVLTCALAVVLRVVLPYIGILMPKVVLDQIAVHAEPSRFIMVVGGMALLLVVGNYLKGFADHIANDSVGIAVLSPVLILQLDKSISMDFELLEDPDYIIAAQKAEKVRFSGRAAAKFIPSYCVELLSNCIGFLLYAGIVALIHPLLLLVLLLTSAINWLVLSRVRKYAESSRNERSKLARKLSALGDTMRAPAAAKDIRLYSAFGWLHRLYSAQFAAFRKAERKVLTKDMHAHLTDALMILLRDAVAYALLIWLVLQNRLTLGEFVLVFAAVGSLAGWISGIISSASDISKACVEMNDVKTMLTYPDRMNNGDGIPIPPSGDPPPSITFRGVSYTYPNTETPALDNIDLHIASGEHLAIVGVNGAGKTTLVKLLCGLYSPCAGEAMLNDRPICEYNRDEYYTLFSAVFQNIHFLASSIAENVSQEPIEQTDRARVRHCLKMAGLEDKIDTLPEKEDTLLERSVNPEATELSGGEKQKLMMARALYKDAPVLVLDEPTAALDPLAENEVYRRYAELTEGKTSVFISHRLASTRFCDRIILLDGSKIAEQGTHDELMSLGGIYANMFEVQASYYQED